MSWIEWSWIFLTSHVWSRRSDMGTLTHPDRIAQMRVAILPLPAMLTDRPASTQHRPMQAVHPISATVDSEI